jgi:hypothetical protein
MPSAREEHPGAPGVGPAVDALLEVEPVQDELAAPVEQVGQRRLPVRSLEAVVALDSHHWHAFSGGGNFVHRLGDRLFSLGHGGQGRVPFGLTDDRRASERHGPAYPDCRRRNQRPRSASGGSTGGSQISSATSIRSCSGRTSPVPAHTTSFSQR